MTNPKEKTIGWTIKETIGEAIINPSVFKMRPFCPICKIEVPDMTVHIRDMSNLEHDVLEVMIL